MESEEFRVKIRCASVAGTFQTFNKLTGMIANFGGFVGDGLSNV